MKLYRIRIYCVSVIFFLIHFTLNSQVPPRELFNIVFENNFNDDLVGSYNAFDYVEDWNMEPGSTPQPNVQIITDPDANYGKAMRGFFPKGTIGPSATHGWSWYSYIPIKGDEIYFSYDIKFKPGFEWVHGGKIPGLMGGSITSGQLPTFSTGFLARLMWKGSGSLVFYVYHHDQNSIYGSSYDFEDFNFQTDKWYNITIRVVLNTVGPTGGNRNGILEGFINGKLAFQKTDLRFRNVESINIDRMYVCSFFGGSEDYWQAARDEWIDTDNYLAYTYSTKAVNVPRGLQLSSVTKQLLHPYVGITDTEWKNSFKSTEISKTSISMSWTDYPVPATYTLQRKNPGSSTFTTLGSLPYGTKSFTDKNLAAGMTYEYQLNAGNSAVQKTFKTLDPLVPYAPSGVEVTGQTKSAVTLKWTDNSSNETGFRIERSLTPTSGFVVVGNLQSNITDYIDYALQPGTKYYYRLNAFNTDGASEYSAVLEAKTDPLQIPAPPAGLIASAINYTSATVLWTDNAINELGFDLERCGPNDNSVKEILDIPANSVAFTDTGLVMNSSYLYRIRSKNEDGTSAWSNQIEVITPVLYPPAAPTKLKSTKFTDKTISVSWLDNSNNEDGFIITRSLAVDSSSGISIQIMANDTSFTDSSLVSSTTYQYTIKAINIAGSSSKSNKNIATTLSLAELKRCKDGLIAYYNFGYNPDYIVYDQSGFDEPLNLSVLDRSAIRWQENNTMSILSNTALVSITAAKKVVQAIKKTGELTFECWIKPREPDFSSEARIISLSSNNDDLGFILDQDYFTESDNQSLTYTVRMQTESTVSSGYPEFKPEGAQNYINMQHLVYSRDTAGCESLYLNGIKTSSGFRPSSLSTWKDNYYLRLGNESDMLHSWKGDYHTIALFNKALTADQVINNFSAGPCDHIKKKDIDYAVELFPNPVRDEAYMKITPVNVVDLSPQTLVRITDTFGKLIYQESVFNPNTQSIFKLDFSEYEPGFYVIQVISGMKQKTEKVVVLK